MVADILSVVSVDVLALSFDTGSRTLRLGVHRRAAEPFAGELALPGVVVRSGERLVEAAGRALTKLGAGAAPGAIGQLRTFDEPTRDPRGPSLSIAMWAAFAPGRVQHEPDRADAPERVDRTEASGRADRTDAPERVDRTDASGRADCTDASGRADRADASGRANFSGESAALWTPIDAVPHLAFDHDHIVAVVRPLLADMLWRDLAFTRALTGDLFSATDAVDLTRQLSGEAPHRANLNRVLANTPGLQDRGTASLSTGGRPPKMWGWEGASAEA